MNRHIVGESALGALIGAIVAGGLYSVFDAVTNGWGHVLPGALAIAGSCFAIFFALYYTEFTVWHSLKSGKRDMKPSH